MAMDVSGFTAPQYGVDTTKRVGVMKLIQWQELPPVVADTPVKTVPVKPVVPVQPPKQSALLIAKVTEKKSGCWCGKCPKCKDDTRRYREQLLRKG